MTRRRFDLFTNDFHRESHLKKKKRKINVVASRRSEHRKRGRGFLLFDLFLSVFFPSL